MKRWLLVVFLAAASCCAQVTMPLTGVGRSNFVIITLESKCSNTGAGAAVLECGAWDVTPTVGDAFVGGCYTNNGSFDPSNIVANDPVNGFYDLARSGVHPANADDRVTVFVKENVAGGTTVPQCQNWEANGMGISGYAFKGVPTGFVLDGASAVNLFNSFATTTAPTAGTAGSLTNANEMVFCQLVTTSSQATTGGASYLPGGTLTGVINTLAQYTQYQGNPAGTVNCPYTLGTTKTGTDIQIALLNAASSGGYRAPAIMYGVPAAAQTNAASATVAILNGTSGSLSPFAGDPAGAPWTLLAGSACIFDTSVAPLGTLKLIINGVPHTLGDAAASIKCLAANVTTTYQFAQKGLVSNGTGTWLGSWMRMGTNETTGKICDTYNVDGTIVEGNFTTQVAFDTTNSINFQFELAQGNIPTVTGMFPSPVLNKGQDYFIITHVAGINEATDDLYVFYEATPGTLPWILHDHFSSPKGGQVIATTTATASSGASTIVVAVATGIVPGQSVFSATTSVDTGQVTRGTKVCNSYTSGTSIPICLADGVTSAATNASMSATPVEFAGPKASTTGSTTLGSKTLTVTSGTGLVSGDAITGQYIGMAGVAPGTWLVSGSGTTWTMSQKAVSAQTTQPVQFWTPFVNEYLMHFGKYSSCTSDGDMWFSGFIYDPYGTILPLIANGTVKL